MTVKFFLATASFISLSTVALAYDPPQNARTDYNFNSGWLENTSDVPGAEAANFADAGWKKVTLPYSWNEDSAFKVLQSNLPTGVVWYRKHFKVPADAAGKKVFLEFEGIRQAGEFYLNGESIGRSENGVMAFGFDITDKVKSAPQENILSVRIDNDFDYKEKATGTPFQWNVERRFYPNYGGINKNVFLHVTDKLHQTLPLYSNLGTTGVYVYAQDFNIHGKSAKVMAEAQVKNDYAEPKRFSYEVSIVDPEGKLIQTIQGGDQTVQPGATQTVSASAVVSGLNFWSWGYGYLYDVYTTLKVNGQAVDVVKTRTGFRKTDFANGFLKLNDRAMQIHGYAQRSTNEWPGIGQSQPPWMSDFSNALFVEGGGNLVRWMHVTPPKQEVESCDRVGLIQSMPAADAERDAKGRQWEQRMEVMRDAIIYNRNNPSILFYESGNNAISDAHMTAMKAIRDKYDPHGGRAIGCREMQGSQVAEFGGDMFYINKSATKPMWAMEYSRDEGLRKYWDNWTAPFHKDGVGPTGPSGEGPKAYNRNQDSHAVEDVARWYDFWRERPGTGERVNAGGVNIYFSDSQTHPRGAANYRCSGEVDAMRLPKDGFFAHQVMWDGWVDVEHPRIHIIGHWNYVAGVKKPVFVVSSADKVELFLNGKSQGFGDQSSRFLYTWKELSFQTGEIRAVGYDAAGKKLCETAIKTAGEPVALKLTTHTGPNGLKADGADMALVDVEVVDAQGNRCPTALNVVTFDLQGAAEWRGGIAAGPVDEKALTIADNHILSKDLPVECGINRVILRSSPQAGQITLGASSPGLKPATIQLTSKASLSTDGLSKTMTDVGLTARLDRGPTPAGDAIVPLRKAVHIVRATAGASADQVAQAFDDNEDTRWINDGQLATGWIEFELEHPATLNQVTLKLGGTRSKSYPLRITVDGNEVFSGTTPKTLGYVTLPFKQPTQGTAVRIALTGAVDQKDAFGMVEVTGKKLNDAKGKGSGTLEVVEAEIYGPVK